MLSNLSASSPESTPSLSDVQTLPHDPQVVTPVPEPRNHMLSLSVNASCLTPPNVASKPEPPFLIVNTRFLVPPSVRLLALLNIVLEITPSTKLFGAGFDVGLLVPVSSLIVF